MKVLFVFWSTTLYSSSKLEFSNMLHLHFRSFLIRYGKCFCPFLWYKKIQLSCFPDFDCCSIMFDQPKLFSIDRKFEFLRTLATGIFDSYSIHTRPVETQFIWIPYVHFESVPSLSLSLFLLTPLQSLVVKKYSKVSIFCLW